MIVCNKMRHLWWQENYPNQIKVVVRRKGVVCGLVRNETDSIEKTGMICELEEESHRLRINESMQIV